MVPYVYKFVWKTKKSRSFSIKSLIFCINIDTTYITVDGFMPWSKIIFDRPIDDLLLWIYTRPHSTQLQDTYIQVSGY